VVHGYARDLGGSLRETQPFFSLRFTSVFEGEPEKLTVVIIGGHHRSHK
jgi:hypothetical protein